MAEWLGTTSRGPDEWRRGRIQFGQLAGHAALTSTERTREEHGFALPRLEFARGEVAPAPWTLQVTG